MSRCLACEAKKIYAVARKIAVSEDFQLPVDLLKEKFPELSEESAESLDLDRFLAILLVVLDSHQNRLISLEHRIPAEPLK